MTQLSAEQPPFEAERQQRRTSVIADEEVGRDLDDLDEGLVTLRHLLILSRCMRVCRRGGVKRHFRSARVRKRRATRHGGDIDVDAETSEDLGRARSAGILDDAAVACDGRATGRGRRRQGREDRRVQRKVDRVVYKARSAASMSQTNVDG